MKPLSELMETFNEAEFKNEDMWIVHRFHIGCAFKWFGEHMNCPFCKQDFTFELSEFISDSSTDQCERDNLVAA